MQYENQGILLKIIYTSTLFQKPGHEFQSLSAFTQKDPPP